LLTLPGQPDLEGHYLFFGHVISGCGVTDALAQGDMLRDITPRQP